ncbi:MAG: Radical domain protein [Deltaproteobacteria bacterium]|jgi:anaerobic magnesium-protoporphyrin IX monomethyl ester cyclase|nr:Radical domain protein [Deltaproteobacteria bacterium]
MPHVMNMNILLINPAPSGTLKATGVLFPPLGLLYIAAYAEKEGHQVAVRDLAIRKKMEDIDFKKYDIVGISTDTTRHRQALQLAKKAKASGCMVVMGGPHPSYADEEILSTQRVDFIVRGEGEVTFSELVATLQKNDGTFHSVQGISFFSNGQLVRTPPRPFIENLDSLPLPARHLIHMDDYRRTKFGGRDITPLITSRGCPYQCAFCASSHFWGTKVRMRSVESVLKEIGEIYDRYHFNAVAFVDDTFNVSPKRVMELCRVIIDQKLDLWWWNLSRIDLLLRNEEMVKEMVRAGGKAVFIGVESSNPKTLNELKKGIDVEDIVQTVEMLKRNGVEIHASYILGGLHDDVKTIHETIRFAKRLDTNVAQFAILTPYPGTAVYEQVKDRIFKWRSPWSFFDMQHLVFKHDHLSFIRMEWLLLKAHLLYYTRSKKAIRDIWHHIKKHRLGIGTLVHFLRDYFGG